jgi:photosystem II stability/assembly factor-like uncharacterized protein
MRRLLSTALLLSAFAVPANAQWHWAHPQPQGHTLRDVVFLDDNDAIAVGDVGTIVVSHDGGNTWTLSSALPSSTPNLRSVDRVDADRAVAVGDGGAVLMTLNQGATWFPVSVPFGGNMLDVSFGDALHGIIIGVLGLVYVTSDGGFTWAFAFVSPALRDVDMISGTEAFAVGDGAFNIQHSTDGGMTWSPVSPPASGNSNLTRVDFFDAVHGVIATPSGPNSANPNDAAMCYVTSNGGATWSTSQIVPQTVEFTPGELNYPVAGTIFIASEIQCCTLSALDPPVGGGLAISNDNGANFGIGDTGRAMFGLARNSAGVVLIVGMDGRINRRPGPFNGPIPTVAGPPPTQGYDPSNSFGSSSFFGSQVGVVVQKSDNLSYQFSGNTTFFAVTHDGGQSWIHPTAGVRCNDVVCMSASEMLGVGSGFGPVGAVLRSTNGGTTWTNIWGQSTPANIAAIAAASSTHAVAVGGSSALVIDNGMVTVVPTGGVDLVDVAFGSPSVVLAVGAADRRSTDGGSTWGPISGSPTDVFALDFITPVTAFGISPAGILRSDDTGDTWVAVPSGAVSGLKDIAFSDSDHGMAVGTGQVLVTGNGGTTWGTISPPTPYPLNHVTMVSPNLAYVSGAQSIVFRYGELPVPTLVRSIDATPIAFGADLRWDVLPDNNLSSFSITRSSGAAQEMIAQNLSTSTRSFRDQNLVPGKRYEYQLIAIDRDGSYTQSMPVSVTIPKAVAELLPNQPNPFNPVTTIRFVVPERMRVTISVHDVAGRVVATLLDDVREPGIHEVTWHADGMASGVYFTRMHAGKTDVSRKMVLLK